MLLKIALKSQSLNAVIVDTLLKYNPISFVLTECSLGKLLCSCYLGIQAPSSLEGCHLQLGASKVIATGDESMGKAPLAFLVEKWQCHFRSHSNGL